MPGERILSDLNIHEREFRIELDFDNQIATLEDKLKESTATLESLANDISQALANIDTLKYQTESAKKRLNSIETVGPVRTPEYGIAQKEFVKVYNSYIKAFQNSAYLRKRLSDHQKDSERGIIQDTSQRLKNLNVEIQQKEFMHLKGGIKVENNISNRPSEPKAEIESLAHPSNIQTRYESIPTKFEDIKDDDF